MRNLLVIIFAFVLSASAVVAQTVGDVTSLSGRPVNIDVTFNESYFESRPWIKEFHYVVVVNKANSGKEAQTIKVFEYGQLIKKDKVSTGRDQFEGKGEHHSKKDSWTVTPTGYYTPYLLDINHRSAAYGGIFSTLVGGVRMPYAIFFTDGIALHQAPKGTESMLGKKASGGCIRLPGSLASDLFSRIKETEGSINPKFNVDGSSVVDAVGKQIYAEKSGYSALIIVQNKVIE